MTNIKMLCLAVILLSYSRFVSYVYTKIQSLRYSEYGHLYLLLKAYLHGFMKSLHQVSLQNCDNLSDNNFDTTVSCVL